MVMTLSTELQNDVEIRVVKKDIDKARQVLLYILNKKPGVGRTVLHKLFYFIDFDYYEKYEESIMGLDYFNRDYGPFSDDFSTILNTMVEESVVKNIGSDPKQGNKYQTDRSPDIRFLNSIEIKLIDDVLDNLAHMSARDIKYYSHGDIPYRINKKG